MTVSANILTRKEVEVLVELGKESCDWHRTSGRHKCTNPLLKWPGAWRSLKRIRPSLPRRVNLCVLPDWLRIRADFLRSKSWFENGEVPRTVHVNTHDHCLHLWKPVGVEIPLPPIECV